MFLPKDIQLFHLRTQTYKQPSGGKIQPQAFLKTRTTQLPLPQQRLMVSQAALGGVLAAD